MREFNIAVDGKASGNANTDALTLADLTVQELLVAALRDGDPVLRTCRVEGEESTGDMLRFSADNPLAIAIDPIDGTKQYRDKTGNGYSVIVHLHDDRTPLYSLVFVPEASPELKKVSVLKNVPGTLEAPESSRHLFHHAVHGTWVEVEAGRIVCGEDDPAISARSVLDRLPNVIHSKPQRGAGIYLIGFQQRDTQRAREVDRLTVNGRQLEGRTSDEMAGSIYPLMATGEYVGSLIHSPNIYDFPVSMHIARVRGGDAVQCHDRRPVDYRTLWMDRRAGMLRFPAIVACSDDAEVREQLCRLAEDWTQVRYVD